MLTFREGSPIEDVTFLKPVQDPDIAWQKTSIVDVLCKDQKGNLYIVEMQVAKEKEFTKRAQYYAARAYSTQMRKNGKYEDLKEIIFLAITNFVMFPDKKAYKSDHVILDKESLAHDLKDFSFTFLELPKFNKPLEQVQTIVDKWAYFFKNAYETSEKEVPVLAENDPVLEQAYEELNQFSWSEQELLTYEDIQKKELGYAASMDQKFDEGLAEGARQEKLEIAKNLLRQKVDPSIIQAATGLTVEEIEGLA